MVRKLLLAIGGVSGAVSKDSLKLIQLLRLLGLLSPRHVITITARHIQELLLLLKLLLLLVKLHLPSQTILPRHRHTKITSILTLHHTLQGGGELHPRLLLLLLLLLELLKLLLLLL